MHGIEQRTALITGGSQGVGLRIATVLADSGMNIVLLVRSNVTAAGQAVEALRRRGVRADFWQVDITDRAALREALEQVVAGYGPPSLLVNNAGATAAAPLLALEDTQWQQVLQVNLTGTFNASVETVRYMQPGAVVINIAGASAHRCYPGAGAFGPSKAAVVNLTSQMAIEWAERGIRVCGISPGPIRDDEDNWAEREPLLAAEVARLPLKRAVSSHEVAQAVAFLSSSGGASFTGQMLVLDGGGLSTWYMTEQEQP